MSREVRRVPLDWKHPVEHNPHWEFQASTPFGRSKPASKLHGPTERFISLFDDYPGAVATWEQELRQLRNREGFDWRFGLEYHLTGYKGHEDTEATVRPVTRYAEDGETEISIEVRDEDHLLELLLAEKESEKPNPTHYMPVFDVPESELGWCLYQTVSEGAPVTPVFATADELIEHLSTIGQDWGQEPMRRSAAESLVRSGSSLGSFVGTGGRLYKSDTDADLISALPKAGA
jgi:DNA-directed RNA polymerase subunit L